MLSFGSLGLRGLGPSRLMLRARVRPRPRTLHSANRPPSASPGNGKTQKYLAGVVAVAASGLWLATSTVNSEPLQPRVPLLDDPSTARLAIAPSLSKEDVSRILSEGAYSLPVNTVAGVSRYDGTRLVSGSPCEDRFTHGTFPSPRNDGSQWMAWAVFDGHAGWQTADLLEKQLLPFVRYYLDQVKSAINQQPAAVEVLQAAVKRAFVSLDNSIMNTAQDTYRSKEPLQDKVNKLVPGYAGSCALLSMYDPATATLHVACTGDSRAVLGRKAPDGTWEAVPLSVDQTGSNEAEVARISSEHPGEENLAKDGRVLGLMVTRAFGDGRWKWPLDVQRDLWRQFNGPAPLSPTYDVRTPPYLTAEPVMTATKIGLDRPSFLIMATDGLWDNLSSQQAVELVGKWLDAGGAREKKEVVAEPAYAPFDFGQFRKGVDRRFVGARMTVQDDNAAVHLVRNSLGGNHHELVAGRLVFSAPFSRRQRDDITVQVVFFGNKVGP